MEEGGWKGRGHKAYIIQASLKYEEILRKTTHEIEVFAVVLGIYLSKHVQLLSHAFEQLFCIPLPFVELQLSPL